MQAKAIHVREAVPSDAAQLSLLVVGFRDFLSRSVPSDEEIQSSVVQWLSSPNTAVSLACRNEVAVGYATTLFQFSLWANGIGAVVSDLFVSEQARKSGVGRLLVAHALGMASNRGALSATLSTNEMNVASTRIYESLGFSSYSTLWQGRQLSYRKSLAAS